MGPQAVETPPAGAALPDGAELEAPALLRVLWADPQNMAEHIALWSTTHVAPRAAASVARLREAQPDTDPEALERSVIQRQTRVSMTEGAFVGGPFIVLIPVAFCAALLAQAQMALELAALAGYTPADTMRAADLLVLQGAYSSTDEAAAALDAFSRDPASCGKRLPRGTRIAMIKRMAYLLGLLAPSGTKKPSRLRSVLGLVGVGLVLVVGFVLPLVWVPYMANAMRKSSLAMGERAGGFYAERRSREAGVVVRPPPIVRVSMTAGLTRMLLLIALPVVVAVVVLVTDVDIGTGRWASAGIFLIVVSAVTTVAWLGYRWWRRRSARR